MDADSAKVAAKIAALNLSLDDLEAHLEPLFAQTLPESIIGLEKIQQAKLQVDLPYLVYDLIFIYLKTRGVDPKTHPVVAELDRVRKYFDKIKAAEDPAKRPAQVDKAAATRFIKHAIAQTKLTRPPGQDEGQTQASGSNARVLAKITSKMLAREEYQKQLREEPSDGEEDELEVFDEISEEERSGAASSSENKNDKGKARATEADNTGPITGQKRRRPPIDPFAGYGDETPQTKSSRASPSNSTPASDTDMTGGETGTTTPVSEAASGSKKMAKMARKRARKQAQAATIA